MEHSFFTKFILSIITILVILFLSLFLKRKTKSFQEQNHLSRSRYFTLRRLINVGSFMMLCIILVLIWGISIKNVWISITGILAMIAVAFFAVWSLVGNILAGIIVFFTSPFKINDQIEILPDQISGKVLAINTFFTLISDNDGNLISIPNSLLFQKYLKKIKKQPVAASK